MFVFCLFEKNGVEKHVAFLFRPKYVNFVKRLLTQFDTRISNPGSVLDQKYKI